jgi:hypothetical protein
MWEFILGLFLGTMLGAVVVCILAGSQNRESSEELK